MGLHSYSTKTGATPLAIFSLPDTARRDGILPEEFPDVKTVRGCYKGVTELAYVCTLAAFNDRFRDVCADYGEESVLVLGPAERRGLRPAYLSFFGPAPNTEYLGLFGSCPEHVARTADAWTYDGANYYTTFTNVKFYDRAAWDVPATSPYLNQPTHSEHA